MPKRRTDRLNSLLREVISDVIKKEVKNPGISELLTVTQVAITADLRHAKVHISVIGDEKAKNETVAALNQASGFIAITSSKQVVMRHFPELTFLLDESIDKQMRIQTLIDAIKDERHQREESQSCDDTSS